MIRTQLLLICLGTIALLSACKEKQQPLEDLARANAPAQPGATAMPTGSSSPMGGRSAPPSGSGKLHRGTIAELQDVSNYTYIKFSDKEGLEHWAAVLKGEFKKGDDIAIVESIVQKNFTSPSLNKTFESIIFGNVFTGNPSDAPAAAPALPKGHPQVPGATDGSKELPEGHPPVDGKTPAGQLPEGHPSVDAKNASAKEEAAPTLPEGHPPIEPKK